jgi:hypothetical protein
MTEPYAGKNFVPDEMAVDPVRVYMRDLDSTISVADEEETACWVGENHMYRNYTQYGWSRQLDTTTVEAKTAIWQLQIPMSVTPENVFYEEDIDHYPFANNGPTDEPFQYSITHQLHVATPMIYGPTPVEELASIETEDVFEDAE